MSAKVQRFVDEQNAIPHISNITGQGRLAALLGDNAPNFSSSKGKLVNQTDQKMLLLTRKSLRA